MLCIFSVYFVFLYLTPLCTGLTIVKIHFDLKPQHLNMENIHVIFLFSLWKISTWTDFSLIHQGRNEHAVISSIDLFDYLVADRY